jgi:hypothetical protein
VLHVVALSSDVGTRVCLTGPLCFADRTACRCSVLEPYTFKSRHVVPGLACCLTRGSVRCSAFAADSPPVPCFQIVSGSCYLVR